VRAVLFKGWSQYEGARTFIDQLAPAFQRRGYAVDVVDLQSGDPLQILYAAAEGPPTAFAFSINMLGEARDPHGRTISDLFRAPHVVWHVDYVLSQVEKLELTPRSTAILTVDPTQNEALDAVFGPGRFAFNGFSPHAAVGELAPDDEDAASFAAARDIPILWSGSAPGDDQPPWSNLGGDAGKIFADAFDAAMAVEWMPAHQALDESLRSRGLDPADPGLKMVRCAATMVDTHVRATRRLAFLKALAKTKLPIHICGLGWERHLYRFKSSTYLGPIPMTSVTALMRRSRIVLNTNGNFGAGSHERPLSALLAGAAAFSDFSRFYDAAFDRHEIALFRWADLPGGMEQLVSLHADPGAAFGIARAGKARVAREHRWDARVDIFEAAAAASATALELAG
jgi:hypothetical protein